MSAFAGDVPQYDDQTLILLRRSRQPGRIGFGACARLSSCNRAGSGVARGAAVILLSAGLAAPGCGRKPEEAPKVSVRDDATAAAARADGGDPDRRPRRARSPGARRDAQGAAPPLRRPGRARAGLRGPARPDRRQPDHLPALHRRADDRAPRASAEGPRARDRDGLGLPERRSSGSSRARSTRSRSCPSSRARPARS